MAGWWVGPGPAGAPGHLVPRWLFLRGLGIIYFSAFYSLLFQIRGMLGPQGLLPAGSYLQEVAKVMGRARYWYAPTLLWFASGDHALMLLCWMGLLAALLLISNLWPRVMLAVCFVCFLSFVAAAQDFSGYQSDGMLLGAGFICYFLAPRGWRPGLAEQESPARAPLFLLRLLWFTIYFESGVAKYFGGDRTWRDLSAMNEYYQNGPLPTWVGWYAHQLPRWCHQTSAFVTLFLELLVPWMLWLPRRARIVCFFFVTILQVGIILTANYAFLNYLVLALGIFLLDDLFLVRFISRSWCRALRLNLQRASPGAWYASLLAALEGPNQAISLSLASGREASKGVMAENVPNPEATLNSAELMQSNWGLGQGILSGVDFLRDGLSDAAADLAGFATAGDAGNGAGAVSNRQLLRTVRENDLGTLRN